MRRQTLSGGGGWVADEDGTGLRQLIKIRRVERPEDTAFVQSVVWPPDGRMVAFTRWGEAREDSGLYVINADGTGERKLVTSLPALDVDWSPDGRSIVFSANNIGDEEPRGTSKVPDPTARVDYDVWIYRDGKVVKSPFSGAGINETEPRFLSDGRVLFTRGYLYRFAGEPVTGREELVSVSDDTETMAANRVGFSPDGRWTTLQRKGRLYLMNADGTGIRRVGPELGHTSQPVWASDSMRFFFTAFDPPFGAVNTPWRMYRFAPGSDAPPSRLSLPQGSVVDWTDGQGVVAPPADRRPPGVVLVDDDGEPIGFSGARTAATAGTRLRVLHRKTSSFLALDAGGLRRVEVAIARIKGRGKLARCRFVRAKRRATRWRSCRRPVTIRLSTTEDWRSSLRKLRRGTYVIGFRTSDAKGNRTRRIKLVRVRVR